MVGLKGFTHRVKLKHTTDPHRLKAMKKDIRNSTIASTNAANKILAIYFKNLNSVI